MNYGLVHHYFGGKDAVLEAGLNALREEFMDTHGDATTLHLLTGQGHPFLRALVRSQVDYPDTVAPSGDFPIGTALVDAVAHRLAQRDGSEETETTVEAKARVITMVSIQLCYGVFGPVLLDGAGVSHRERANVERALAALYDSLALLDSYAGPVPRSSPRYPDG